MTICAERILSEALKKVSIRRGVLSEVARSDNLRAFRWMALDALSRECKQPRDCEGGID